MNPRLRTAIQAAKQANTDNIIRAINKSEISNDKNYDNLNEGFGPFNTALIIETLTNNKNRAASSIRTVLQKNGGRLGETGSTTHMFNNYGIIQIEKNKISDELIFEIAINCGAKDCLKTEEFHEIITEKEDFYKIKTELEKKIDNFAYSAIEWRAINFLKWIKIKVRNDRSFNQPEDIDDVQNVYTNANLNN